MAGDVPIMKVSFRSYSEICLFYLFILEQSGG